MPGEEQQGRRTTVERIEYRRTDRVRERGGERYSEIGKALASSREPQRRVRRRNEVPDNRLRFSVCLNEPANRQMPPDRSPEHAEITPIPARLPSKLSTEPPCQFFPRLASSLGENYETFVAGVARSTRSSVTVRIFPARSPMQIPVDFISIKISPILGFYFPGNGERTRGDTVESLSPRLCPPW